MHKPDARECKVPIELAEGDERILKWLVPTLWFLAGSAFGVLLS